MPRNILRVFFHHLEHRSSDTPSQPPRFVEKRVQLVEGQLVTEYIITRLPLNFDWLDVNAPTTILVTSENLAVAYYMRVTPQPQAIFPLANAGDVQSCACIQSFPVWRFETFLQLAMNVVDRLLLPADGAGETLVGCIMPGNFNLLAICQKRKNPPHLADTRNEAKENIAEREINVNRHLVTVPAVLQIPFIVKFGSYCGQHGVQFVVGGTVMTHDVENVLYRFASDERPAWFLADFITVIGSY